MVLAIMLATSPTRTSPDKLKFKLGNETTEFSGSVRLLTEVAESFGATVTAQERQDWQTLGRAAYVIDHYLDAEVENPIPDIAPLLFSGHTIPGVPEEFTNDCQHWMSRQSENRQAHIQQQLGAVRILVERQAVATTPFEVVSVRREEAELLADMLSLRSENREDSIERKKFNYWLTTAMRAGYLLDSLKDIKEDYESGASGVKPGMTASGKMATYLLKETIQTAKISPKALGKGALVMLRYEIKKIHPDLSKSDTVI
jgi:hypothetical protein